MKIQRCLGYTKFEPQSMLKILLVNNTKTISPPSSLNSVFVLPIHILQLLEAVSDIVICI